jgi:hypothetical protein
MKIYVFYIIQVQADVSCICWQRAPLVTKFRIRLIYLAKHHNFVIPIEFPVFCCKSDRRIDGISATSAESNLHFLSMWSGYYMYHLLQHQKKSADTPQVSCNMIWNFSGDCTECRFLGHQLCEGDVSILRFGDHFCFHSQELMWWVTWP